MTPAAPRLRSSPAFGRFRAAAGPASLAIACALGAGCSSPTKSGVEPFPEADRAAVRSTLRAAAGDVDRIEPAPATTGLRWSDVGRAAGTAGAVVDLVLVDFDPPEPFAEGSTATTVRARYIGLADEPAELVVERRPAPEVYVATATVGLFGDEPERADRLLAAFDEAMRAWGAKRAWPRSIDRADEAGD